MIRNPLRTNYLSWFLRVAGWDGLLPLVVILLPHGIELLFPNRQGFIEGAAIALPIAAFLLRIRTGKKQIESNQCSIGVRRFQFCVFCLGILPLIVVESLLVLSHVMPQGALFQNRTDLIVWSILLGIYLAAMTVAMYPGQVEQLFDRPRGQWDDLLCQGFGAFGALSYWHAKCLRREINGGSNASNAARLRLSDRKLRQMCPSLYFTTGLIGFARCLFGDGLGRRVFIRDMLAHGDGRAAVVLSSDPLRVACYCDDSDAVCVLGFRERDVGRNGFHQGDRLLTVLNSVTDREGCVAADLVQGDLRNPAYINFWPLVAELLSDDAAEIERRKSAIPDAEFIRCRWLGEEHLRLLPGAVRDGRADLSLYPAY